jgi:anaerobic carbon-monoxide dehydrogenase iron sulfur subunit
MRMKPLKVLVVEEACSECRRCQLACSERHTGAFRPSAARVRIEPAGDGCAISFTDDCAGCGACAEACFYGALTMMPAEPEP